MASSNIISYHVLRLLHYDHTDGEIKLLNLLKDAIVKKHGESSHFVGNMIALEEIINSELSRASTTDKIVSQGDKEVSSPVSLVSSEDIYDLICTICKEMFARVGNILVECKDCHELYHQQCHVPNISDDVSPQNWSCVECIKSNTESEGS